MQLARHWPGSYVQAKDLATQENLPSKFLESILLALRRGDFLESKVGSGGGYKLSRPPRDIRVGELIRRLEGDLEDPERAATSDASPGEIAVRLINQRLLEATEEVLGPLTLEQLLDHVTRAGASQQSMYYI